MISIILPAYNTPPHFLREAVASVIAQTETDWELWIIDDSSSGSVKSTVEEFHDSRIHYEKNPRNLGMAASRNRGLELAQGEWIALLDHDDVWLPQKLAVQKQLIKTDPQCGMVYSPALVCQEYQENIQPLRNSTNRYSELLLHCNIYSCSTILIRAELLKKYQIRFDSAAIPADDYDLYLQIARVAAIRMTQQPLVRYRKHTHNCSANMLPIHLAQTAIYRKQLQLHFARLRDILRHPLLWWRIHRSLGWAWRTSALEMQQQKHPETEVKNALRMSIKAFPLQWKNLLPIPKRQSAPPDTKKQA